MSPKPYDKNWVIRQSPERLEKVERLRNLLKNSGREAEQIHGSVTTAAIFDAALAALERELAS